MSDSDDFILDDSEEEEEEEEEEKEISNLVSNKKRSMSTFLDDDEEDEDEEGDDEEEESKMSSASSQRSLSRSLSTASSSSRESTSTNNTNISSSRTSSVTPSSSSLPSQPSSKANRGEAPQKKRRRAKDGDSKSESKSKIKDIPTAKRVIFEYFTSQNRPYSVVNLVDNLHKRVPRGLAERCCDILVSENQLKLKEYGKNKVYFLDQRTLGGVMSENEIQRTKKKIGKLRESNGELSLACSNLEREVLRLRNCPLTTELEQMIEQEEFKHRALSSKVAVLEERAQNADPLFRERLKKKFNEMRGEWKKRKRMAADAVDLIADGMEKKPKEVMKVIGLETDEDAGVTLPDPVA